MTQPKNIFTVKVNIFHIRILNTHCSIYKYSCSETNLLILSHPPKISTSKFSLKSLMVPFNSIFRNETIQNNVIRVKIIPFWKEYFIADGLTIEMVLSDSIISFY